MKVVFMGTPAFALPCLEGLYGRHEVAAVFCQPDRPRGRGYKTQPPPVKEAALERGTPVYQPKKLRDAAVLELLREIHPDVIVVVAYGKLLPPEILSAPRFGCVNVHASLLPKLRGASPIQSAIVQGETVTGITTMRMNEGMDTGDILEQVELPIGPDETAIQLHDRLMEVGAGLLLSTLDQLEAGEIIPQKQDESKATYAPMLKKEMGIVDWAASSQQIHNQIRGLQPWPSAATTVRGKRLKLFRSTVLEGLHGTPGELLDADGRLIVATGDSAVELLELQLEGSKRMPAGEMLRGHPLEQGSRLGEPYTEV